MHPTTAQCGVRSLAQVRRDENVEIGHIAFDAIRERCPALGLEQGTVVRCVECRDWDLILRTPDATEVVIDRFYAAFIEVRPVLPARAPARDAANATLRSRPAHTVSP